MEKFYVNLSKYSREIINYEKNEMPPLTDENIKSYNNQNFCYIYKKQFRDVDDSDDIDDGGDDDDEFDARKVPGDAVEPDSGSESTMIVIMMYLLPEGFRVILQNLILKMMIMMMMKN